MRAAGPLILACARADERRRPRVSQGRGRLTESKDLERILAEDSSYAGLREQLAEFVS